MQICIEVELIIIMEQYFEGQRVEKKSSLRMLLATLLGIMAIGAVSATSIIYIGKAIRGYDLTPTGKTIYDSSGMLLVPEYSHTPLTSDQIFNFKLIGILSIVAGIIFIIGLFFYASIKIKMVYQNGKLIQDPADFLKQNAAANGIYGFILGIAALIFKLLGTTGFDKLSYTTLIALFACSMISIFIARMNNLTKLKNAIIIILKINLLLFFADIVYNTVFIIRHFPPDHSKLLGTLILYFVLCIPNLLIILLFYRFFYKKVKSLETQVEHDTSL